MPPEVATGRPPDDTATSDGAVSPIGSWRPAAEPITRLLSGWGRTAPSACRLVEAPGEGLVERLESLLAGTDGRARANDGLVARGLGRSYGDAAQCAGGTVVEMTGADAILEVDPAARRVRTQAGVSLEGLLVSLLPLGLFPPVTPGTRWVTVGGAIASDVHGKNHHRDGSFGSWVSALTLVTPAGGACRIGPDGFGDEDRHLFWATVGGMGLTGIVAEAEVNLLAVETSRIRVDTERASDLDQLMAKMAATDHRYRYSVAWVDASARGRHLGRSVLSQGDHAAIEELAPRDRAPDRALAFRPGVTVAPPPWVPSGLLNGATARAFNAAWYHHAPRRETGRLVAFEDFFYPLDGVRDWNRLYGRLGFVQYQLVVPFGAEDRLRFVLERLAGSGLPPLLAVLKRFGDPDPGPLSFPLAGWTLALDLPAGRAGLGELLDELDEAVVGTGGRVYLAKDARLRPELVEAMYPRLAEWQAVRTRADPGGVLRSDLGRRLGLVR